MNRRDAIKPFLLATTSLVASHAQGAEKTALQTPAHLQGSGSDTFSTQPWGDKRRIDTGGYVVERVGYQSQGVDLVGNVFAPPGAGRKPAVVVIGPVAYVKEQSPVHYASRLARDGFVALAFDPRFHGESGGVPRRLESREAKVEDLRASIDYLVTRADVDPTRISILGVCQGVNWAIEASTLDARVRSLGAVAGHYLGPETAALYVGSEEKVAQRLGRAATARAAFEASGAVQYIPIVSSTDTDALLTAPVIRQFYERWADRGAFWDFHGLWENRVATMSETDIWGHDVAQVVRKLQTPAVMVHADRAASGPVIPRRLFDQIPARTKELIWLGGQNQMQFYEDPITIDQVVGQVTRFFRAAA